MKHGAWRPVKHKRRFIAVISAAGLLGAAAGFIEIVERIAEQERRGTSGHRRQTLRASPTAARPMASGNAPRRFSRRPTTEMAAKKHQG